MSVCDHSPRLCPVLQAPGIKDGCKCLIDGWEYLGLKECNMSENRCTSWATREGKKTFCTPKGYKRLFFFFPPHLKRCFGEKEEFNCVCFADIVFVKIVSFTGPCIKRMVQEQLVFSVFVRLIFWKYPFDLSINVKFKNLYFTFGALGFFFTNCFLLGRMWQIPLSPQTTVGLVSRQQPGGNMQSGPDTVCGGSCLTNVVM